METPLNPQVRDQILSHKISEVEEHLTNLDHAKYKNLPQAFCARLPLDLLESVSGAELAQIIENRIPTFEAAKKGQHIIQSNIYESELVKNGLIIDILIPDVPFLLDSIADFIESRGYHLFLMAHPILPLAFDPSGNFLAISEGEKAQDYSLISFILRDFKNIETEFFLISMQGLIETVLDVTSDFKPLCRLIEDLSHPLKSATNEIETERVKFFAWLLDNNAILLGSATLKLANLEHEPNWDYIEDCQGFLKYKKGRKSQNTPSTLTKFGKLFQKSDLGLNLFEMDEISIVHKQENIQLLVTNITTEDGEEKLVFIQFLFTNHSSNAPALSIPTARRKVSYVIETFAGPKEGHMHKELKDYYSLLPKNELFRLDRNELLSLAEQIQFYREYTEAKLYSYHKPEQKYLRLTFCLSSKNFSPQLFGEINKILFNELGSSPEIKYYIPFGRNTYSYHIFWYEDEAILDKLKTIEKAVAKVTSSWLNQLSEKISYLPIYESVVFKERYLNSFSSHYQAIFKPEDAVNDIRSLERLLYTSHEQLDFRTDVTGEQSTLLLYSKKQYKLSELMPILQHLSFTVVEENSFDFTLDFIEIYVYSFTVTHDSILEYEAKEFKKNLRDTMLGVLSKTTEDDLLNGLVFKAGFSLKEINLFMLYRNYFMQLGTSSTRLSINKVLLENINVVKILRDYFGAKFQGEQLLSLEEIEEWGKNALHEIFQVATLAEDIISKSFLNLMTATIRTNYFIQGKGEGLAIKVKSALVEHMPLPRPLFEIYIHAVGVEGIHLRSSKIARGGLRHSDRQDDFRTEVLGLVKTQKMKNVVIVPEGSKGGFYTKKETTTRAELMDEGKKQYQVYIRSLLSLTDNIIEGQIVTPTGLLAYDEPDPYLVVAADKGTAHLSDTANAISMEKGFWLGDAFASGGEHGYDHKAMGITAKGAWECVKLHFLEMGTDIQTTPFSVVGIGDMGGDVFGNGMLLSPCIQLKGAFNHIHIFIDPNPDHEKTFPERQRLFTTPGSSWRDFNPELISQGGGVFDRSAKSIILNDEIKAMLKTDQHEVTGEELIRLVLKAPVDLLWNGGIGTYIKAEQETNHQVGDPSNDNVRVSASEIHARVVGEGGNLGLTQRGRVEFCALGGRINTDAIDNSGGVDCSDHEVNLKIMLKALEDAGHVEGFEARNAILRELEEDVGELVLASNKAQGMTLSMDVARSKTNLGSIIEWITYLSMNKYLDRRTESFSPNQFIEEMVKQGIGIPRPDLAILLSYTKMFAYGEVLKEDYLGEAYLQDLYLSYFPATLKAKFNLLEVEHRLKREIVGTILMNYCINRAGVTLFAKVFSVINCTAGDIVATYFLLDQALELQPLRESLLARKSNGELGETYKLLIHIEDRLQEMVVKMLIRNKNNSNLLGQLDQIKTTLIQFAEIQKNSLKKADTKAIEKGIKHMVQGDIDPENLSALTRLELLQNAIVLIGFAGELNLELEEAFVIDKAINEMFSFDQMQEVLFLSAEENNWSQKHRSLLINQLSKLKLKFANRILQEQGDVHHQLSSFTKLKEESCRQICQDLRVFLENQTEHLSALSVIITELETLTES
ncbi:MAG: NAD-glutamate dehydrogenase [SAR324 cluster bacterium]|nr:NAD-glutamate dehydrogenase [SAR324 cluster bacterium]